MEKLKKFLLENKVLFWDIWDLENLSENAIEERILKYWNWRQVKELEKILWKEKFKKNYIEIISKKRINLWKKTINLFNLYFNLQKNA